MYMQINIGKPGETFGHFLNVYKILSYLNARPIHFIIII